jgi:hypothetical protein
VRAHVIVQGERFADLVSSLSRLTKPAAPEAAPPPDATVALAR